ncbi:SH3 domain-containing protein [Marivita hallyeonensis]|uniref:SH3 domain-containing protein n=1 Tax=Marivita hallyeonensis TaxID=996342 RepID=A0A1M5WYQ3_9RHOB|nr:SH3 domain-containing protein [Marivita hallyeonensis]SHH92816.1 SH3 domain-containing protein [Marivita hallyeonensis]
MNKYIVIAFAFMGVWFYEASGGADFEPGENTLVVFAEPKPIPSRAEPRAEVVARADTSATLLTDVVEARGTVEIEQPAATEGLAIARMEASEPVTVADEPDQVAAIEPIAPAPEPVRDIRFVDADRVNMRSGPGTDFDVVGKLLRDDMIEILDDAGTGWLRLRVTATGEEGWMADWLVTAAN